MSSSRIIPATPPVTRTPVALPDPSETYGQDAEWCVVRTGGRWREVRFHDYADIFAVPGLYERLFYDILECRSPATITGMLGEVIGEAGGDPTELRALDLGAGNGIMGEELRGLGAEVVVGVDILSEAADAAARDRPTVYDDYFVVDMTDLDAAGSAALERHRFNCLTCVAALGFADIPPAAFRTAYNLIAPGGWVAFNIKEDFLDDADRSGFADLIARSVDEGRLELRLRRRYRHRLGTAGQPLHYVGLVGVKREDLPAL
jgi:predicted TPR repeat methyltransferase